MKIESFDLDLNSTRTYSESYSSEFSQDFSFVNIMDSRMSQMEGETTQITETHGHSSDETGIRSADVEVASRFTRTSEWIRSVDYETENNVEAVTLAEQFREELMKMRQIMASIIQTMEKMMVDGCSCEMHQMNDVFAMPMSRTNYMGMGGFSRTVAWEYEYSETTTHTYEENENTLVSADGIIKTADNREIDFTFDFEMSRSFLREDSFEWTETGYVFMDPLVIRTEMDAPLLSGGTFSFDLDLDGEMEDMPAPGPGMGFLALDLNEDGEINDGSELFGPSTNNGFGELAEWDWDGNDWIDENDEVFDRLTLWESNEDGEMQLTSLKDAGIGAIYLAGVESSFDLTDEENETWARVGRTSIALTEEGDVLPVQELEYTV